MPFLPAHRAHLTCIRRWAGFLSIFKSSNADKGIEPSLVDRAMDFNRLLTNTPKLLHLANAPELLSQYSEFVKHISSAEKDFLQKKHELSDMTEKYLESNGLLTSRGVIDHFDQLCCEEALCKLRSGLLESVDKEATVTDFVTRPDKSLQKRVAFYLKHDIRYFRTKISELPLRVKLSHGEVGAVLNSIVLKRNTTAHPDGAGIVFVELSEDNQMNKKQLAVMKVVCWCANLEPKIDL